MQFERQILAAVRKVVSHVAGGNGVGISQFDRIMDDVRRLADAYRLAGSPDPAAMDASRPATEPMFYIQHAGCCGNSLFWWRPNGQGYTCELREAWKVTKAEAERICRSRPKQDIPQPVALVDSMVEFHINGHALLAAGGKKPRI